MRWNEMYTIAKKYYRNGLGTDKEKLIIQS